MFRQLANTNTFISKIFTNSSVKKTLTALLLVFIVLGNPVYAITSSQQAELNAIDQKINDLNAAITNNKKLQQTTASEVAAIDDQVQVIQLQISQTAGQIAILNDKITSLNAQIDTAEIDLASQKKLLGEYVKQMYIDGQTSQIQLILTSNNFSDFVDKSQYLNTMQDKVKEAVGKVEAIKKDLTAKKTDLEVSKSTTESLQASQVAQRDALSSQQAYKQSVIAGLVASTNNLIKQKNDSYAEKLSKSQAFGEVLSGGSTSYPYGNPVPLSIADTVDDYGYYKGECTSYVAWKRSTIGKPIPPAIGNGGEWTGGAAGYPQSNVPQYGDVMVFPNLGYYGHVAFVEATRGDGWVFISEYNVKPFTYSERWVNPYNYYGAFFIH